MEYKILINSKGIPVIIQVPEKPDMADYIADARGAAALSVEWEPAIKSYEQALSTALSDESKHIAFKDGGKLFCDLKSDEWQEVFFASDHIGETFDLPENISVSFESDCQRFKDPSHLGGGIKCSEQCYFKGGGLKVCEKLAVLTPHEKPESVPSCGDGWISVKDRLPQSLVNVSVFFDDEHGTDGFVSRGYHSGYADVWTVMTWIGPAKKKVTHWQPLPKAPTKH